MTDDDILSKWRAAEEKWGPMTQNEHMFYFGGLELPNGTVLYGDDAMRLLRAGPRAEAQEVSRSIYETLVTRSP